MTTATVKAWRDLPRIARALAITTFLALGIGVVAAIGFLVVGFLAGTAACGVRGAVGYLP